MSARELFYDDETELNKAEERAYRRDDLIFNVTEDILIAMEDMHLNKQELARRLGKSKSFVTQTLSGARNMTLGTLSDICFALDCDVKVAVRQRNMEAHQQSLSDWVQVTEKAPAFKEIGARNVIIKNSSAHWTRAA